MGKIVDNVKLDAIGAFVDGAAADPSKLRKTQVIEGEWLVEEGPAQFQSTVKFEGGEATFQAANPTFMGGSGQLPGPMHYCFFGLAACYTGVFATTCAAMGIELKKLTVRVEADINFTQALGLANAPIMEEVRVKLHIVTDAPEEKVAEAEAQAQERCPVVYTMRHPVPLVTSFDIERAP
jgi:uncharacterized OsmC-like protein